MDGGCQNTWTYEGWLSQEMTKLEMILEEWPLRTVQLRAVSTITINSNILAIGHILLPYIHRSRNRYNDT